jgi:ABC-type multidrug transport system ATPase subunit
VILRVERLVVRRGDRVVIDNLDLAASAGEVVGIVGKNGCGKSTLLAAIAGVLAPRDGRIAIAGASVWGSSRERVRARAALGYAPEHADPPGFLLGGELWALCAASRRAAAPDDALVAKLGLDELRDIAIERMSLGQRRRACLAAALLGPPALLVLDEPDNGLDAARIAALGELVRAHAAGGGAVLIATHDAPLLADVGARVVSLDR